LLGWIAQADPTVVDTEARLILLIGLSVAGALIMLILLVLMSIIRIRKSRTKQTDVQSRLKDLAQPTYEAAPLPPTEDQTMPASTALLFPEDDEETLTPIQQKLLAVEEAAEASTGEMSTAAGDADSAKESELTTADIFGELALEEEVGVDSLWDDINFDFGQEGDLAFLMGDDLPEDTEPEPALTILADVEARGFLEQLNQYKLDNHGQILETDQECRLIWKSPLGTHEILVTVQDTETLNINGDFFPATPDGVKKGIIAALNNANY